jgi:hypothetical protein
MLVSHMIERKKSLFSVQFSLIGPIVVHHLFLFLKLSFLKVSKNAHRSGCCVFEFSEPRQVFPFSPFHSELNWSEKKWCAFFYFQPARPLYSSPKVWRWMIYLF